MKIYIRQLIVITTVSLAFGCAAISLQSHKASALRKEGNEAFRKGDMKKAKELYLTATELDPKDVPALNNLVLSLFFSGETNTDWIITLCTTGISLDPTTPAFWTVRGNALSQQRRFDEAMSDFDRSLKLDPKGSLTYRCRGLCWMKQKQFVRAIADLSLFAQLDPSNVDAHVFLGAALHFSRQDKTALPELNKAIELDRENATAYFVRGQVYQALYNTDLADRDMKEASRLDDNLANVIRELTEPPPADHDPKAAHEESR